jgi:hypothetical protein
VTVDAWQEPLGATRSLVTMSARELDVNPKHAYRAFTNGSQSSQYEIEKPDV